MDRCITSPFLLPPFLTPYVVKDDERKQLTTLQVYPQHLFFKY